MSCVDNPLRNRGKYRIYTQNDLEKAIEEIKSEKINFAEAELNKTLLYSKKSVFSGF